MRWFVRHKMCRAFVFCVCVSGVHSWLPFLALFLDTFTYLALSRQKMKVNDCQEEFSRNFSLGPRYWNLGLPMRCEPGSFSLAGTLLWVGNGVLCDQGHGLRDMIDGLAREGTLPPQILTAPLYTDDVSRRGCSDLPVGSLGCMKSFKLKAKAPSTLRNSVISWESSHSS